MRYPFFLRFAVTGVISNWLAILSTTRSVKQKKMPPLEVFFASEQTAPVSAAATPEDKIRSDREIEEVT